MRFWLGHFLYRRGCDLATWWYELLGFLLGTVNGWTYWLGDRLNDLNDFLEKGTCDDL